MRILMIIGILVLLAGCAEMQVNNTTTAQANENKTVSNPYFCGNDADCVVKDVHNCCGYYPKCVNKDYTPDIAAVEKECKEKGMVSICGFADITGCKCVNSTCVSVQGEVIV